MNKLKYDFLIIGSGLAGLYAANYASRFGKVALLSKTTSAVSNSYLAQGGIAAAMGPDDSPDEHYKDSFEAGRGLCDKEALRILVEEARPRIEEIIDMGMEFDPGENGRLAMGMEGGHKKRRVLHAGGDATGKRLVDFFTKIVVNNPNVDWLENTLVYKLISDEKNCYGAYAHNYDHQKDYVMLAGNTIIATGGASGVYKRTTNPFTSIGDGIALAYDADVAVENMEFVQFHPSSFYSGTHETFLISEAVRGEGAYLLNDDNERFMLPVHELAELAPRDVVSKAIYNEITSSGKPNVFLSLSHLDAEKTKQRFSTIAREAAKYGLDITKDLIPVAPAAHYMIGGIKTNLMAETNIKHLFAIGEIASTGIHGANRLASNSLLECLVFGKRAVDAASESFAEYYKVNNDISLENLKVDDNRKEKADQVLQCLSEVMNTDVGMVRNKEGLEQALDSIAKLDSEFGCFETEYFCIKIKSVLKVCELIAKSALLREESRGGHIREDYPEKREKFQVKIVQQKNHKDLLIPA